jgi:hypothetical protein
MFDMELYQQVLDLTAPWKVTDVRLDVESTEIHVHVEHPEGCRWSCPHCSRELACYDHAPERQWRHLNTCQFHTLVHARVPRVECPEHGVVQVKVPWAEPHGRFTLLMERFVIDVLQACQTVKGACTLVGISWDQAWHVLDRAVARGLARKEADTIARIGIGLVEKIKAYQLQDKGLDTVEANLALGFKADSRDYGIGIQLLKDLGLRRVRLLTNNPKKTDAFIYGGFDLEVVDQVPILPPVHEFNEKYLATKREKLGHRFP